MDDTSNIVMVGDTKELCSCETSLGAKMSEESLGQQMADATMKSDLSPDSCSSEVQFGQSEDNRQD